MEQSENFYFKIAFLLIYPYSIYDPYFQIFIIYNIELEGPWISVLTSESFKNQSLRHLNDLGLYYFSIANAIQNVVSLS